MREITRFRWCCVSYLKWSHGLGGCWWIGPIYNPTGRGVAAL